MSSISEAPPALSPETPFSDDDDVVDFPRATWDKPGVAWALAVVPFFIKYATSTSMNGQLTSYTNYVALVAGVIGVGMSAWALRSSPHRKHWLILLAFCALHLVRGFYPLPFIG